MPKVRKKLTLRCRALYRYCPAHTRWRLAFWRDSHRRRRSGHLGCSSGSSTFVTELFKTTTFAYIAQTQKKSVAEQKRKQILFDMLASSGHFWRRQPPQAARPSVLSPPPFPASRLSCPAISPLLAARQKTRVATKPLISGDAGPHSALRRIAHPGGL